MTESQREDDTVQLAIDGDPVAIAALLEPIRPRLEAFVNRRSVGGVRWKESASDIVQSTFREILVNLPEFDARAEDEGGAFANWLYVTALRKLRDRQRYYRRAKRDVGREQLAASALDKLYRSTVTPSEHAIGEEARERLRRTLQKMSDSYREVIDLAYFSGLPRTEIASRLGKTPEAVNSLLARALAKLAIMLDR